MSTDTAVALTGALVVLLPGLVVKLSQRRHRRRRADVRYQHDVETWAERMREAEAAQAQDPRVAAVVARYQAKVYGFRPRRGRHRANVGRPPRSTA